MTAISPSIVTDSQKVEFKTTDQSMWSSGQAFTINDSWTLFSEGFSDSFSEFDDDLTVSASAGVSLVFSVQADAGSLSLKYPIDVSFQMPNVVTAGQQFTVQTVNNGLDASAVHFDAKFPEFKVDLNAIFTADFALDFDSDFFGSDSVGYNYNKTIKLVSLHSGDKKTIVDGFDVYLPKDYDKTLTHEQSGSGPFANVTLDVTTPDIATVDVDVLSVIEDIVGPEFPSLSGSFLDGDITYNLLTAELDAGLAITQQFQFLPTGINLTLTAPWGESVTIPVGQTATFNVPYYWDKDTSLSASYSLQGNLVNQTGFVGTATLDLTALGGNVDLLDYGPFGPLYSQKFPVYDSGAIYIYNPGGPGGFAFQGFNTPTHKLKIDYGSGTLVAPGGFSIDGSGFTANDAALIQSTLNSIAKDSGASGTNAYTVGGSGSATAETGKLNLTIIDDAAVSATLAYGFEAGFVWAAANGASLTGDPGSRLLAAAPKRGGAATLTAGANEIMVAGQQGQVTFNITSNFQGLIAGLQAGDVIHVLDFQSYDVSLEGATLVMDRLWGQGEYAVALSGDLALGYFDVAFDDASGMYLTLVAPPPQPGTEGDDAITGSSGSEILNGGPGNDSIFGGGGSDTINLGSGADTLGGYWGDMNGDVVSGFTSDDRIEITGSLIGRANFDVALGAGTATLTSDGTSLLLNGNFNGGDFMVITRGTGADAHTTITFQNYLPSLREGVSVDPTLINGVANEAFLTGDGNVHFTVDFRSAGSSYSNTLGSYRVAVDGSITDVHILFGNTRGASGSVDLGVPAANERIGFFLIQNGYARYGNLPDNLSFVAPGTSTRADLDDGVPPTLSSATLGTLSAVPIFHSFATLNPGDANQVLSGVEPGGQQLLIGFEDLPSSGGDNDFQDVVISVRVDTDHLFLVV